MQPNLYHRGTAQQRVFGNTLQMTRGTCFRNSTHCGTWFNPALNLPLFDEDAPAFEIKMSQKIKNEDRIAVK
jgi:hypothetical protein